MHNYKSMMASILLIGSDFNKIFRYHFARLHMIRNIAICLSYRRMGSAVLKVNDGKHVSTWLRLYY